MATVVIMPRQGQSVESCIINNWAVKVGDTVAEKDVLFSYETDKSAFDEPAPVAGEILAILHGEGDEVPCLEAVCVIGAHGEAIPAELQAASAAEAPKAAEAPQAAPEKAETAAPAEQAQTQAAPVALEKTGEVFASPRAKRLADKAGVDWKLAAPTGPEGRIIERDIEKLLDEGPEAIAAKAAKANLAGAYEDIKLTNIRKVIAKSMHESLSNAAQLTMSTTFDATKIMAYRAAVKARREAGEKLPNITLNDIVVYVTAQVLKNHPEMNALYMDGFIRQYHTVNMGVAVDTERGLMVPTVFNAETLSIEEIATQDKALAEGCKAGNISPDKLSGGSFTITNIGSFGIESFTPVINPPQVAILGVCGITTRIKATGAGIATYPAMGLSLTIDHRAIDGAPGARFLKELCDALAAFEG